MAVYEKALLAGAEWTVTTEHWVLLQVAKGDAYVRNAQTNGALPAGDLLVVPPRMSISILASTLGDVLVRGINVRIDALTGFLTVIERNCLETSAPKQFAPFKVLPATDRLVVQFTEICQQDSILSLSSRLALVYAFADFLSPCLNVAVSKSNAESRDAQARLREFVNQMPETELENMTLAALAKHLHCCERHARRLFREVCGCSFRHYVSELRLKTACQLLAGDNGKIIDVAHESGHSSLALFNYLFKKRFHMTPTQWRQYHSAERKTRKPRSSKGGVALMVGLGVLLHVFYTSTDSVYGETSSTAAPAAPAPLRLKIDRYEVVGNTLLSERRINDVLAPYTGEGKDLDAIKKGLATLQAEYRDRGYPTVVVGLPPQKVTNGVVHVEVTEGKLVEIKVLNNGHYSSNNVIRSLPGLKTDVVLNSKLLQAELDRANNVPDRQIYPEVRPGPEPGTSALILDVKDRIPLHARGEVNNYSTPGTPNLRVNGNVSYDNLWQREHSVGLQYGCSPEELKQNTDVPGLPLIPLDYPAVTYYSGFYRAPLTEYDSIESEIDQAPPGRFGYNEATRQFVLPPSSGRPEVSIYASRTTTDDLLQKSPKQTQSDTPLMILQNQSATEHFSRDVSAGLRLSAPLPEIGRIRSSVSVGLDYKEHLFITLATNLIFQTTVLTNDPGSGTHSVVTNVDVSAIAANRRTSVAYLPLYAGWDGFRPDRWGQFTASVALTAEVADPLDDASAFASSVGSTNATGKFVTLRSRLSREQRLVRGWSLLLNSEGQWANEPLVTLEQYGLGGVGSIRGYSDGERYGDTGWMTQCGVRSPTFWVIPKNFGLSWSTFTDYGQSFLIDPGANKASEDLWGVGMGLAITIGPYLEGHLGVAWALLDSTLRKAGTERYTLSVSGQF